MAVVGPPGAALHRLAIGHYLSSALFLAAKLDLAERLATGAQTAEALAKDTATHPPSLRRVLRLLASAGVLAEDAHGRFALTPDGDALRSDAPGSMKAMVTLFAGPRVQGLWRELEFCVRTGRTAFQKDDPDATVFGELAKDPEAAANFDRAMAAFAPQTAAAVAAAYDFSGFERVMDVGGGNGALLAGIVAATEGLRGVVLEQPAVAERARAHVAALGLADRVEVAAGSFFERLPRGADAIVLKHVLHDWDDARAAEILRRCRAALPAPGRVLVVEALYPDHIDASPESLGAAANDVNMLVATGGRQRTRAEHRELLASASFALARVVPTAAPVSILEGVLA